MKPARKPPPFRVMYRVAVCWSCSALWSESQLLSFTDETVRIISDMETVEEGFLDHACPRCRGPVYPYGVPLHKRHGKDGKGQGKTRGRKPDVYDAEASWKAGMSGLAMADSATTDEERALMLQAIRDVARDVPFVTSDAIWKKIGDPDAVAHQSALGGQILKAKKLGIIGEVIEMGNSERVQSHRRPMRVWSSLDPDADGKEREDGKDPGPVPGS